MRRRCSGDLLRSYSRNIAETCRHGNEKQAKERGKDGFHHALQAVGSRSVGS